jgi:predicted lipoprotein with Yx(FWY)xxD motif
VKRRVALAAVCGLCAIALVSAAAQERAAPPISMPAGIHTSTLADGTPVLTDARGMTLYTFLKDTPQQSNCNDECAKNWPPAAAAGTAPDAAWTVITRADGSKQWAYRGRPLYGWIKDTRPGDITGDGVANGAWKIAAVAAAPNLVRVHLAHVTTTFPDAPNRQGLIAAGLAEARIAAQHAALAAKAGANLDAIKLHAGHVLHAVDPASEPSGPGLGFGVRRAASGLVEHIQLASKVPSVSNNVLTYAARVLVSGTNTIRRCDEIAALVRQIKAASAAADAAPDVARLNTLAQQLASGADINKDGEVGWQTGEGGLEQAQAQIQVMLKGEGS